MRLVFLAAALLSASACQTAPELRSACLEEQTPEVISRLRLLVSDAVGRADIEFGPFDLTTSPTLPVLPPPAGPFEMNDPAMPRLFELVLSEGQCYLRDRETGRAYLLENIRCRPV